MAKKESAEKNGAAKAGGKKAKRKGGWRIKLLMFLFAVGAVVLLQQTTILLLIAILPAIVAYIVDDTPRHSWFKTVFCFNLSGALPYVSSIYFQHNNSGAALQAKMGDFSMWLVIYGAAGAAWLTLWLCNLSSLSLLRLITQYRIEQHRKKLSSIGEEWGLGYEAAARKESSPEAG